MQRVMLDSDLYVDWIEAGLREDLVVGRRAVQHFSTVVLLELQAGARDGKTSQTVWELYRTFRRAGRLLAPSPQTFWQAGSVLRALQQRHGYDLRKRWRLVNDCLIAMSSRQIGATVLTRNERDFQAIRRVVPFALTIVP